MIAIKSQKIKCIGKFLFSSSSRGFLRSGVGQSMDSLQEYVEKGIQDEQVSANLEQILQTYLIAISKNDKQAIQQLTKKNLSEKTVDWINEVSKKGEQFQLLGKENPSTSLQGFTTYSYLYGLKNQLTNGEYEKQKIYNLNKNFLVKRLLVFEGLKVHKIFSQDSIAVEAYIYSNLRLSLKKDSKQQQSLQGQQHQFSGYKVCFVCDGKLQRETPHSLLQEDKRQVHKDEQQQKLFELNGWRISDINDWIYEDLQQQDFSKWVYSVVIDQNAANTSSVKTDSTTQ